MSDNTQNTGRTLVRFASSWFVQLVAPLGLGVGLVGFGAPALFGPAAVVAAILLGLAAVMILVSEAKLRLA